MLNKLEEMENIYYLRSIYAQDSGSRMLESVSGQKPLGQNPLGQNPLGQKPTRT